MYKEMLNGEGGKALFLYLRPIIKPQAKLTNEVEPLMTSGTKVCRRWRSNGCEKKVLTRLLTHYAKIPI